MTQPKISAELQNLGQHMLLRALEQREEAYSLQADMPMDLMDASKMDTRNRDLQEIQDNFRFVSTTFLGIAPIVLRQAKRTKVRSS